jgi:hypothetical protein
VPVASDDDETVAYKADESEADDILALLWKRQWDFAAIERLQGRNVEEKDANIVTWPLPYIDTCNRWAYIP